MKSLLECGSLLPPFRRRLAAVAFATLLALALLPAASAQRSADILLESARQKQMLEGDLKGAIRLYEQIVKQHAADRAVVAKSMLQMAECHEKLGQAEARRIYEQIAQRYGDQTAVAAQARERLAALGGSPKTPGTLTARQVLTGGANVVDPECSITADGRLMVMTHWETGDLAIRDLASGEVKRLNLKVSWQSSSDFAEAPLLSPDKRSVAYAWYSDEGRNYQFRLAATEPGAQPRILIRDPELTFFTPYAWSPDGKSILAMAWRRDRTGFLAWISAADGVMKVLRTLEAGRSGSTLSLSPDGRYIAYDVGERRSDRDIEVLTADGNGHAVLLSGPTDDASPVWAPDGSRIFFVSNRAGRMDLFSLAVQDGKPQGSPQLVKADIGDVVPKAFVRSGLFYYVFTRNSQDVFTVEIDSSSGKARGLAARLSSTFIGNSERAVWSPDGRWIAFASRRGRKGRPTFVLKSVETGEERVLSSYGGGGGRPTWFHSGFALLQVSPNQEGQMSVSRFDAASGKSGVLLTSRFARIRGLALAPDDKMVYVAGADRDTDAILRLDLTTGAQVEVYRPGAGSGSVMSLALSPDGKMLVFDGWAREGEKRRRRIVVVSSEGNDPRALIEAAEGENFGYLLNLAWSPDGKYIYFIRAKAGSMDAQLWRIPAAGGAAEFTGVAAQGLSQIAVSPDGSRLAYTAGEQTSQSSELWVLENALPAMRAAR